MKNAPLEAYYKAQNIVPEEEWNTFFDALKQPLPTTFRMAGSRQYVHLKAYMAEQLLTCLFLGRVAHELNHIIKTSYVPNMADTVFEGEPVAAPVQIPWCVRPILPGRSTESIQGTQKGSPGSSMCPKRSSGSLPNSKSSILSWFSRLKWYVLRREFPSSGWFSTVAPVTGKHISSRRS